MLTYELQKTEDNLIFYHYYPDGNGTAGIVSIDKITGETAIIASSKDDFGNRYAFKLMKHLREFFINKAYKETGTIAWY